MEGPPKVFGEPSPAPQPEVEIEEVSAPENVDLERRLDIKDSVAIVVGIMVGTGIFKRYFDCTNLVI